MPISTLTSKGQVTVPKAIRERLGLTAGDILEFAVADDGSIEIRRLEHDAGICGVLRDYAPERPVSTDDMRDAVRARAVEKSAGRAV